MPARVRVKLTSNMSVVTNGSVDDILKQIEGQKFLKLISLGDGQKEVFVNTDMISIVEAV